MTRILYIGDPTSVHDIKWVSYFSSRSDFETFFLCQQSEMELLTPERKELFNELNITIEGPIESYSVWRFWDNWKSIRKIRDVIKKRKINIVHPLFATPFALWMSYVKIPSVITTRGSDALVVLPSLQNSSGVRRIHGQILFNRFKKAFINSNAITCTSKGQTDRINQLFSININAQIIRTGINVDEIAQLKPKLNLPDEFANRKIIFLPRYIRPIYKTELQLEALNKLTAEEKDSIALLLIKGNRTDDSYMKLVQKHLDSCEIPFHIFNSLTQPEMWSAYKRSALTIMTPKTDGTPNSALEAMAAKCPLILGSFNYDKDLFSDDYCFQMRTDSPNELSDLIVKALTVYPNSMLQRSFENVSKKGNRPTEMERLRALYGHILQS